MTTASKSPKSDTWTTSFEKALDARTLRTLLRSKPASFWEKAGQKKALALFHAAAKRVPAYKDFLRTHGVKPASIKTTEDFASIPVTTKENYVKKYSLAERSWDGTLDGQSILAVSSGTSGEPTIWPRSVEQEREAALVHEFLYTDLFEIDHHKTLMIIGFPMGMYVSGIATALPSFAVAVKHPKLSIVTVGNQKDQALKILKELGSAYDQIVLVGHPFFVKDVIETGGKEGIEWSKTRLKTMFCSEGFNETWREYVASLSGANPATSIFNTYGSSEFLLVGFENPLTILVRAAAEKDAKKAEHLFGTSNVPNLFQYNPLHRYIESHAGDLLITANSGVPLIRFNQHDAGNIIPYESIAQDKSVMSRLKKTKWKPWKLPFVTLSGRSDRTLVFYAANIYPEHIQAALNKKELLKKLTGKFVMEKKYTKGMDQQFIIHVETQSAQTPNEALAQSLQGDITSTLLAINSEYADASTRLGKDMRPSVILHENGDPAYFKPGLKPRYITK